MKTASRVLGSAAFHAGCVVQDSPVYGAERRGAPMLAFTRIAHEPIRERGAIAQPDLVVVADDTLLSDPVAQPLAGCDALSTVLINSSKDETTLHHAGVSLPGHLIVVDFTTLILASTRTLASLSTALGVAAACLVGLPLEEALAGLEEELDATHLNTGQKAANRQLARAAFARVQTCEPVQERPADTVLQAPPLVEVIFDPPRVAAPSIYALANSPERRTGNWRQFRPLLQPALCTRCWICFVRCPEAAIALDPNDYPVVNYDECKGCLLCVHECPTHAFVAEKEVR